MTRPCTSAGLVPAVVAALALGATTLAPSVRSAAPVAVTAPAAPVAPAGAPAAKTLGAVAEAAAGA
ncbi:MAG: hypothetical protein ACKVZ6_22770, partial [Kineosporiaceae bacterium]